MQKRNTNATKTNTTIDINAVAAEYKTLQGQSKAIEPQLKQCKEQLIAHAKDNPALFQGNLLRHANGTTVKKAARVTPKWNDEKVSIEWLESMLDTASAGAISISIDHRKLKEGDPQTALLLAQIDYEEVISTIWSVSLSTVSED